MPTAGIEHGPTDVAAALVLDLCLCGHRVYTAGDLFISEARPLLARESCFHGTVHVRGVLPVRSRTNSKTHSVDASNAPSEGSSRRALADIRVAANAARGRVVDVRTTCGHARSRGVFALHL